MQLSPMMREIEYLPGDGEEVERRGKDIEDLGDQMLESADTLQAIKDADDGQHGKAVESLRTEFDDAYETLKEAGELYKPVGPHIAEYGQQVIESQPLIRSKVDDCESLWATYQSLPGSTSGPEPGAEDEDAAEDEHEAKKAAFEVWNQAAGEYDSLVSTWELAYDSAANGISNDMAGKIRDPNAFWDFVDGLVEVLGWVGLAVGVIAMIAGGPFVALAAIIGAAVFAITAVQYIAGEASLSDLMWETVGILPFGKAGRLFRGDVGTFGKEMFKGFSGSNFKEMTGGFRSMGSSFKNAQGAFGKAGTLFEGGFADNLARTLTGKDSRSEEHTSELQSRG